VHDPLSAGRRLASRAIVWQAGATALASLAFLALGVRDALAAATGGAAVVLAALVSLLIALGGGISPAGVAMARLLLGMAAKWATVAIVLVLGLAVWRLPPLALLVGVLVATVAALPAQLLNR
jgi:F0F1-type ATP synthase assembly protein I